MCLLAMCVSSLEKCLKGLLPIFQLDCYSFVGGFVLFCFLGFFFFPAEFYGLFIYFGD